MKKKLLSILLFLIFILILLQFIMAQTVEYVVVEESETVNVRSGAGLDYETLAQLMRGDKVKVLAIEQDWYLVQLEDGSEGWVYSPLVSIPFKESETRQWPCYRGNSANTGSLRKEMTLKGKKKWEISLECNINFNSSPVFLNNVLYIGGENGKLFYIAPGGEKKEVLFQAYSPINSTPSINEGYIYFETEDGKVYSFNLSSGNKEWEFSRKGNSSGYSPLTGNNGLLYLPGNGNQTLYAVTLEGGGEKWTFSLDNNTFSRPCLSEDMLYVGSSGGDVYCLDSLTGDVQWKFNSPACIGGIISGEKYIYAIVSEIAPDKETDFYIALYAINPVSGKKEWEFKFDNQVFFPILMDNTIYVGCQNRNIYVIDAFSGKEKWVAKEQSYPISMAGDGNFLYTGLYDGTVFAMDIKTRKKVWSLKVDGVPGLPAISGELLYIPTGKGHVYAIE